MSSLLFWIRKKYNKLINFGTEKLGLDLKYFASGGFWTTFGQGTNTILAFLLTIAFANLVSKETYGLYKYILSLAGIMNIFTLSGMNDAVAREVSAGHENALKTAVRYQLKWHSMMFFAFMILSFYYFRSQNITAALSLLILGVFSPLTSALNSYGAYLAGKKQFKLDNVFSVISTFVYSAGIFAALYFGRNVPWLIFAYAVTTFATTLFFYLKTTKIFRPSGSSGNVLQYGRRLTFIGFIGPIANQVDNIILNYFWGPVPLAVYSLARAVPDRVIPFIKNFVSIGLPKLTQRTPEEINKVFYKRVLQGLGAGMILAFFYIIIAPPVFKYLMPKYLDAVFYSQILATGLIFALPIRYVSLAFISQANTRVILANSITNTVVRISLYAILGIWGGILGLALAQAIFYFITFLINVAFWRLTSRNAGQNFT